MPTAVSVTHLTVLSYTFNVALKQSMFLGLHQLYFWVAVLVMIATNTAVGRVFGCYIYPTMCTVLFMFKKLFMVIPHPSAVTLVLISRKWKTDTYLRWINLKLACHYFPVDQQFSFQYDDWAVCRSNLLYFMTSDRNSCSDENSFYMEIP